MHCTHVLLFCLTKRKSHIIRSRTRARRLQSWNPSLYTIGIRTLPQRVSNIPMGCDVWPLQILERWDYVRDFAFSMRESHPEWLQSHLSMYMQSASKWAFELNSESCDFQMAHMRMISCLTSFDFFLVYVESHPSLARKSLYFVKSSENFFSGWASNYFFADIRIMDEVIRPTKKILR